MYHDLPGCTVTHDANGAATYETPDVARLLDLCEPYPRMLGVTGPHAGPELLREWEHQMRWAVVHLPTPPQLPDADSGYVLFVYEDDGRPARAALADIADSLLGGGCLVPLDPPVGHCRFAFYPDNEDPDAPQDHAPLLPGNWRHAGGW